MQRTTCGPLISLSSISYCNVDVYRITLRGTGLGVSVWQQGFREDRIMRPIAAAAVGALIAGVGMYAVGARAQNNPFAEVPALVQTVDGQYVRIPAATPVVVPRAVPAQIAPQQTVYRTAAPASDRRVVVSEQPARRSWKKTAMVIGGSSAGGAGVGGLIGGKKGALIGAALGGGAASIYEATKH